MKIARHGLTLATLLCAAAAVQADDEDKGRYTMTVYSDMAQGRAILKGSHAGLIEELSQDRSGSAFSIEESINLCVAYTQAKQVSDATSACESALTTAQNQRKTAKRSSSPWFGPLDKATVGHAIALNNRGVLYALAGDHDNAREMFEESLKVSRRTTHARKNLSILNESITAAQ